VNELTTGDTATGPAVIEQEFFTCRLDEGWQLQRNSNGDLLLTKMVGFGEEG
jgi:hypothetical protein